VVVKAFFQIPRERWAELRLRCESDLGPNPPLPVPPLAERAAVQA